MSGMAAFHTHLDVCVQCAKHPLNLCPIGNAILAAQPLPDLKDLTEKNLPSLQEVHARTKKLLG